ncbi:hypothetical protein BT69DRAFT_1346976 [Atractiella rhizophila]|nr:hypothetical protein BT69DRAFT_1346976 [Atractiella rhizophila]
MPIYFTSRRDGRPKRQNSSENVSTPRGEYSNPFEKPVGSGTVKVLTKGMTLNLKERVGEFNLGQELKRRVSGTLTPGHLTEHKISLPSPLHTPTCAPAYSPFSTPRLSPEPSKMGTTPPLSSAPTSQSTSTSTQVHKKSASSMEPRGQLRVRVKSANGLEVPSKERSRPYALIQYDHAESITREWGTEARDLIPRQKPGKLIPTQSGRGVTIGKRPLSAFDASNPDWDHEAVFDVLAEHRLLRVAIYDKALRASTDQHAFLGCVEFEPELNEGWNEEISLRLKSHALTDLVPGTVKLSIRFEKQKSKKKVAQEDFQILKRIGEGSFGQVYKVRKKDTKRIYAMKVISKKASFCHGLQSARLISHSRVLLRTRALITFWLSGGSSKRP